MGIENLLQNNVERCPQEEVMPCYCECSISYNQWWVQDEDDLLRSTLSFDACYRIAAKLREEPKLSFLNMVKFGFSINCIACKEQDFQTEGLRWKLRADKNMATSIIEVSLNSRASNYGR